MATFSLPFHTISHPSASHTQHAHTSSRQTIRRLLTGLLISSGIGVLAYKKHSLSRSGVVGAIPTGTATYGFGGMPWAFTLIYFFVSSSFLSHFRSHDKTRAAADKFSKGSQRDLGQVVANGGIATAMAVGYGLLQTPAMRTALEAGYVGALATANADTWATETGVLSTQAPRLITNGQPVEPGTSGGITLLGTIASAGGALTTGIVFKLLKRSASPLMPLIALTAGLAGSLCDSLFGATIQAMYYCPTCYKETERHIHNCGTPTQPLRGWSWMDNDVVNTLATLSGSLVAILLHILTAKNTDIQETRNTDVQ